MSTPRWKKELRAKQLKEQAEIRKLNKILAPSKKSPKKEFIPYAPSSPYRSDQDCPKYASFESKNNTANATAKREEQRYTGDYIKGLAVMHKSNLVPVSREQDCTDYSTMRRN